MVTALIQKLDNTDSDDVLEPRTCCESGSHISVTVAFNFFHQTSPARKGRVTRMCNSITQAVCGDTSQQNPQCQKYALALVKQLTLWQQSIRTSQAKVLQDMTTRDDSSLSENGQ